jgi:hypothetical protein
MQEHQWKHAGNNEVHGEQDSSESRSTLLPQQSSEAGENIMCVPNPNVILFFACSAYVLLE